LRGLFLGRGLFLEDCFWRRTVFGGGLFLGGCFLGPGFVLWFWVCSHRRIWQRRGRQRVTLTASENTLPFLGATTVLRN
jgi:hypothetical protein